MKHGFFDAQASLSLTPFSWLVGLYSVYSLVWPRTEEQISGNFASEICKKPSSPASRSKVARQVQFARYEELQSIWVHSKRKYKGWKLENLKVWTLREMGGQLSRLAWYQPISSWGRRSNFAPIYQSCQHKMHLLKDSSFVLGPHTLWLVCWEKL